MARLLEMHHQKSWRVKHTHRIAYLVVGMPVEVFDYHIFVGQPYSVKKSVDLVLKSLGMIFEHQIEVSKVRYEIRLRDDDPYSLDSTEVEYSGVHVLAKAKKEVGDFVLGGEEQGIELVYEIGDMTVGFDAVLGVEVVDREQAYYSPSSLNEGRNMDQHTGH